jgi:hypothetical protein
LPGGVSGPEGNGTWHTTSWRPVLALRARASTGSKWRACFRPVRDRFGYTLPAHLQALELVRDLEHFEPVLDPGHIQAGDLVWLGEDHPLVEQEEFVPQYDGDELVNGSDYPVKHVAICTGTRDDDGDYLLLHASAADGTNALWPLRRFRDYDRFGRIYAIRRLRREFRLTGKPADEAPVSPIALAGAGREPAL